MKKQLCEWVDFKF